MLNRRKLLTLAALSPLVLAAGGLVAAPVLSIPPIEVDGLDRRLSDHWLTAVGKVTVSFNPLIQSPPEYTYEYTIKDKTGKIHAIYSHETWVKHTRHEFYEFLRDSLRIYGNITTRRELLNKFQIELPNA